MRLAGRGAELFIAVGYKDGLWPEPATAAVLDAQTGDVPVVVVSTDLHATWLNSAALVRLGYPTDRAVLREQDAFDVLKAIGELSPARADQLVSAAAHAAAQRGVVGIVDFEFGDIGPVWQRRMAAGNTALRVHCSVWPEALDAALARGHRTGDPLPGTQGRATMGPLKIIIDGSLNTRTAYCYDPYPGRTGPEAHGLLTVAPEQLVQLLTTAKRAGLSTAVHAIGDHANAIALDAYAQAGFGPSAGCTIEHAQLLTAGDMTEWPTSASSRACSRSTPWTTRRSASDIGLTEPTGPSRIAACSIPVCDSRWGPTPRWHPLIRGWRSRAAVERSWHPEQQIPIEAALAASVHGRVEVGARADLAILDADPLTATGHELRELPVAATLLGGTWTHTTLA